MSSAQHFQGVPIATAYLLDQNELLTELRWKDNGWMTGGGEKIVVKIRRTEVDEDKVIIANNKF